MRGDRLFTFPSFKFQPVKLLMKVQSKVFQVQTLGGIRMDFPLSLVLSHILAIKIRYRSRLLLSQDVRCRIADVAMFVCLTSWFLPPSLGYYFPKMQDVDVSMIVCWFVWSVCLHVWPRCKKRILQSLFVWPVHWYTSRFLPSSQDARCRCCNDARGESFMAGIPTSNILDLEWLRFQASFLFTNFSLRSQLVQPENDLNFDILMCSLCWSKWITV